MNLRGLTQIRLHLLRNNTGTAQKEIQKMEQVLLKLAESAANGGWPAAFAIAVTALACAAAVAAVAWALTVVFRA